MKVVTFNCGGFRSNYEYVKMLMKDNDIICVQESLLYDLSNDILGDLSCDFNFDYQSASRNPNLTGRCSGGLVTFWRNGLARRVECEVKSDRILGHTFFIGDMSYTIVNCYFPCDYHDGVSFVKYRETLMELSNFVENISTDFLCVAGDFNADPCKGRFFPELIQFVGDSNLFMCDIIDLPASSYSYVSRNSSCGTSWLDHFIVSNCEIVGNVEVLYGFKFDDHIPIVLSLDVDFQSETFNDPTSDQCDDKNDFILWDKLTDYDIDLYRETLNEYFDGYMNEAFSCNNSNCQLQSHRIMLNDAYNYMCSGIFASSSHFECKSYSSANSFKVIVGWNDYCREAYNDARRNFLIWNATGRNRFCIEFNLMKESRHYFKTVFKRCKANEDKIKRDKLLSSFSTANKGKFWKDIQRLSRRNKINCSHIDGENNPDEIVDIFCAKYESILNNPVCQYIPDDFIEFEDILNSRDAVNNCRIFTHDIDDAIGRLSDGIGSDGIHSNFLKFSSERFRVFLGRFFSSLILHDFIPEQILEGEIRPAIKNKLGNKSESSNYRPVMNSSNILKLFEYCILPKLEKHLNIHSRQFSYRSNTGCQLAIATVKETLYNYTSANSNVHSAVLDMTSAFDCLNFNVLYVKMIKTTLPKPLIRIVRSMLTNTYVHVRFNYVYSRKFKVGNGARQGGCLSGLLFNFYVNDILTEITDCGVGCSLDFNRVNIVAYADDFILLCPSANGLQFLIDKLYFMFAKHCLKLNVDKSLYIIFRCRKFFKYEFGSVLKINDRNMILARECKYLGVILRDDMKIFSDIIRVNKSFLRQFFGMYNQFYYLNVDSLSFLFRSYCSSFYGSELWYDMFGSKEEFRRCGVAYHRCVKKIVNMGIRDCNHEACSRAALPVFNHFVNKKIYMFFNSVVKTRSKCMMFLKRYFRYESFLFRFVNNMFFDVYRVYDFINNDHSALLARFDYVERNEECSHAYGHSAV